MKAITGRVDLIHANDSKDGFDTGRDRHDNLGRGRIDPELVPEHKARLAQRAGRSPRQLFRDYLDSRGNTEDGVRELFDELYDEVSSNQ